MLDSFVKLLVHIVESIEHQLRVRFAKPDRPYAHAQSPRPGAAQTAADIHFRFRIGGEDCEATAHRRRGSHGLADSGAGRFHLATSVHEGRS